MNNKLLDTIQDPTDVQKLDTPQLQKLAEEIRARIIEVMSVNGGHLASNLGTIELTLALHKVFQSPIDKFIWDVSHQVYTHKIVTGRNETFPTIRKYQGLCGFSSPKESPHDHFYAGHAGTALSLALGMAKQRDLLGEDYTVIPVIGDATLTCGMSLEALNNCFGDIKKMIVILNDNEMSISKNVGAITQILSRLINNPTVDKIYHDVDHLVKKIPNYGNRLSKHGHKISESLKHLVSPAAFFEQYGLTYMGPYDGHDIQGLISLFEEIKGLDRPVLVHILTKKGQGMDVAINNPVSYHGAKPFSLDTGKFHPVPNAKPTFPKIFGSHLLKMAEADPKIVAITPAMSAGSCLDEMMKKMPDRCIDVGIAESHSVTFGGGLAKGNQLKVVVSIYATFLQRALDNLFHDVCLQEAPVVFGIDRGGLSPADGSTHHGIYDISFLNAMPNMVICQPRNGELLKELMESAFSYGQPTAIRYPNLTTEDSDKKVVYRHLGKGDILAAGQEYLIITLGHMYETGLKVREKLLEYGVHATVLDPVFIKPLDRELLHRLLKTHSKVITIEEHAVVCGLGSIINQFIVQNGYRHLDVLNCGIPERFVEHGGYDDLLREVGLTPEGIFKSILNHFEIHQETAAQL